MTADFTNEHSVTISFDSDLSQVDLILNVQNIGYVVAMAAVSQSNTETHQSSYTLRQRKNREEINVLKEEVKQGKDLLCTLLN